MREIGEGDQRRSVRAPYGLPRRRRAGYLVEGPRPEPALRGLQGVKLRHCIACNAGYESEPATCPDCGSRTLGEAELQMLQEAQAGLDQERMVPLKLLESQVDRAILTEMLDERSIPWVVHGEGAGTAFGNLFASQEGFGVLLVPEPELERARDIVRDYDNSVVLGEGETLD